jgi:hypothetical protein
MNEGTRERSESSRWLTVYPKWLRGVQTLVTNGSPGMICVFLRWLASSFDSIIIEIVHMTVVREPARSHNI